MASQAYAYLLPGAKHILCRFHHQQGVTHWLKQHFATDAEINGAQAGDEAPVADPR